MQTLKDDGHVSCYLTCPKLNYVMRNSTTEKKKHAHFIRSPDEDLDTFPESKSETPHKGLEWLMAQHWIHQQTYPETLWKCGVELTCQSGRAGLQASHHTHGEQLNPKPQVNCMTLNVDCTCWALCCWPLCYYLECNGFYRYIRSLWTSLQSLIYKLLLL